MAMASYGHTSGCGQRFSCSLVFGCDFFFFLDNKRYLKCIRCSVTGQYLNEYHIIVQKNIIQPIKVDMPLYHCFKRQWYTHEHSSTGHKNQKKATQDRWINQQKMDYTDNVWILNITPPFKGNPDMGHSVSEAWRHDATWNPRHKTINTVIPLIWGT